MNMKKNLKIFLQQNDLLPELYIYMIFVESIRPILFACKDEEDKLYIVSCHCATATKSEWIVAQATHQRLIDLLTDKITIRDVFTLDNSDAYIATLYSGKDRAEIQQRPLSSLDNILPTIGYYMDVESGEFEEELTELQNAKELNEKFVSVNYQGLFNATFMHFPVQISMPEPQMVGCPMGYLLSSNQKLICAI